MSQKEKRFLDVFPNLQLEGKLAELMEQVMVTKVAINHDRDALRVYINSPQWIHKKYIYQLESAIADQLFSGVSMTVKIIERFLLSSQYNPENFYEVYRSSILLELKSYNTLLHNIFINGKVEFPEPNHMEITLADTVIGRGKQEELYQILEKIFCERAGFSTIINIEYEKREESANRRNSELRIQQEARAIIERVYGKHAGEDGANVGETEAGAGSDGGRTSAGDNCPSGTAGKKSHSEAAQADGRKDSQSAAKGKNGFQKSETWKNGSSKNGTAQNGGDRAGSERRYGGTRQSGNPDVIYGRDFEEDSIPLSSVITEMGEVVIRGKVMAVDQRDIKNEKSILIFSVTDFTDSITCKMFVPTPETAELKNSIKKGAYLKIKGITVIDRFDNELTIGSVRGVKTIANFEQGRMDTAPEKRVELHCHTKMSDMDGVSNAKDILLQAAKWGHKACAITDHGVVQAFPEANHLFDWGAPLKDSDFKVLYGMEGYIVDDLKGIVTNSKNQDIEQTYVVFDLETTGISAAKQKIIEIGAVKVENGQIVDRFSTFVNPMRPIPFSIEQLTGINDGMVLDAPVIDTILPEFMKFCEGAVMVAHNADFDMGFIKLNCKQQGIPCDFTYVDTVGLARYFLPGLGKVTLDKVAKAVGAPLNNHHRAVDDAECTAHIFLKFMEMIREKGFKTLNDLNREASMSVERVRKLHSYHAVILAKNETGRRHLYKLVSESHLTYYNRQPKIPKSLFNEYREGLILGSACEAGELFQAIVEGKSDEEIARIVEYYDYLEIQPIGNNAFMLREENYDVHTEEDLRNLNRRIVKLGEQFKKPVVATCDVHFLNPEDEIYRKIIMTGKGFSDADQQAPLYLHTTDEMLEEFSYLGAEKAREVVITNTNMIADMCERVCPIHPDKFPPVIENSDRDLRDICYKRAHEIYGKELPEIVKARLERELNSIISNGYAVMYIIAQKLVWKSNEDGYLVGSRGSVGSSFVATMAGITEVNPLSPHYICPNCHYYDFDSEDAKRCAGRSGADLPDRKCPRCGTQLHKEGFDIPFETFLGFKGNKEPDIDLNFSGEYQGTAHRYTEVIFGKGQTFKAGTIGTLAEKTAYGYVKHYFEDHNQPKRKCEIERLAQGCTGVRRTTGQHPGGIIVLPLGEDINMFTPVQHPANDMTTDIITTHFDYHSIDSNLLKLDILGHDDPTMIRMLQDLSGFDPRLVPLDDKPVMSLFRNTEALGITPEDIGGCKLGCLGIPEFGTDFAMGMLIETKPESISDLIRIAGLSHGTDVWLGNAQELIRSGKATISTAICTRDDIMIYLIQMGLESEQAFTIMESVRKGKGLRPEWEEEMKKHGVPDWYIWSCKKIKYMFPKAHAAAYVMMAYRIAYFKINYPLAYYAAYFSIRASAFSYEIMCLGRERLEYYMKDYQKRKDTLSNKEQDTLKDMRIVQEMYARGFEFMPVDLQRAKAHRFQIIDGKLMPALDTIEGLGEKAADAVEEAVKDGPFLSKDDFRNRTKVSKTVIDLMDDLGLLGDIPESNQISLFDLQ